MVTSSRRCVAAAEKLGPSTFVLDNAAYHKHVSDEWQTLGFWSKLPASEVRSAWEGGHVPGQEQHHGVLLTTKKAILAFLRDHPPQGTPRVKDLANKHGHVVIFLPPYRPELNANEQAWARCAEVGVTLESLVSDHQGPIEGVFLTNGLVLELYRTTKRKQLTSDTFIHWLVAVTPECVTLDKGKIIPAVHQVLKERDVYRRKKQKKSIAILENKIFMSDFESDFEVCEEENVNKVERVRVGWGKAPPGAKRPLGIACTFFAKDSVRWRHRVSFLYAQYVKREGASSR